MPKLNSNRVLKHPGSPKSDERLFESKVNVPENNRRALIDLLNNRLADTIDMQTQAKFAHWNVKGEDFYQLHLLFDSIAEHVEDAVDLVAERVTALGGRANGTARQVAANSSIKEYDLNVMHGMDHVRALLDRLSDVANAARQAIKQCASLGDDATADVFTEIVRAADKDIYFLQSHLQGGITTYGR
jgi:starvation-inducible DNA-binding protein